MSRGKSNDISMGGDVVLMKDGGDGEEIDHGGRPRRAVPLFIRARACAMKGVSSDLVGIFTERFGSKRANSLYGNALVRCTCLKSLRIDLKMAALIYSFYFQLARPALNVLLP
jgi:hypothetical protein